MARLDESTLSSATVAQHLSDHNQLHKKANYVFDVMDYGATGDGSTDDTAAIQACMDAAFGTSSHSNAEVIVPHGIYLISSTIN